MYCTRRSTRRIYEKHLGLAFGASYIKDFTVYSGNGAVSENIINIYVACVTCIYFTASIMFWVDLLFIRRDGFVFNGK